MFSTYSTEYADRINAVLTDAVFMILLSLMGIFYSRLNKKQNKESLDEIEEAAKQQQKDAEVIKNIGIKIGEKLEDANDAMESLSDKVTSSASASEEISTAITHTAEAIQTQTEMNSHITKSLEDIALGLIKRDNETKKDYYNYHDTVKELEYKIKSNNIQNLNTKEDLKIITDAKKVRKIQGEINNSNGNQNKPIKKFSCGKQLKENKKSKQKNYGVKNNINENKTKFKLYGYQWSNLSSSKSAINSKFRKCTKTM